MTNSSPGGDSKKIGLAVKKARQKKGITQQQLARRSNVTSTVIESVETGLVAVTADAVSNILKIVQVKVPSQKLNRVYGSGSTPKKISGASSRIKTRASGGAVTSQIAREVSSLNERRESMIDILASWDLEGAVPDEAGMSIVRQYTRGDLTLSQAIETMKTVPLPSHQKSIRG